MRASSNHNSSDTAEFHVGDRVSFRLTLERVEGTIIEDRGPIGMGGRRLYGVEVEYEPHHYHAYFEMPAVDLELVSRPPKS